MRAIRLVAAALLVPFAALAAQETPTERESARDVVRRLDSLETSLDLRALVTKLTGPNAARDQVVARAKELMDTDLLALGDDITKHPEVGFEEKRSIQLLADYLKKHDFTVELGTAGLPTAFVARYNKGTPGPKLGVILEYDALRGTKGAFHGDQHSTQGPIGMAAGIAIAEYLTKTHTPGTVVMFGTPGEERMPPVAKTVMFDAHAFDGMDIIVRSHSSSQTSRPGPGFGTCCMNIDGVKYTFFGAPAHQLTAWNGRNALTAVVHLFENIDAMRSNIRPEARIQGVITEGGAAPNVVPDRTQADFYIRYPDEVYLAQVSQMVDDAARAAALATGTQVRIDHYGRDRDGISAGAISEVAFAYLKKYGAAGVNPDAGKPQGFEETGSVSSAIPGAEFTAKTSTAPNHTYEMEADALTAVGHQGFVTDAQAMAALLFDFATRPDYRATVKKEFDTIRGLQDAYLADLHKTYVVPKVATPQP
jgi:amidohydrolase